MSRFFVCLFCALVSTWQYLVDVLLPCDDCLAVTAQIAAGSYDAPFVYRPLTPALLVALGNTTLAHVGFQLVMLFVFFWLLWRWCERWHGAGATGVALAALALVLMWPTYFFSTYTTTEWVLWLTGLSWLTARSSPSALPTAK